MKKSESGFTLMEVIVVSVIVAALASISVPIYFNYVDNARQNTVDNLAETAAAAANSFVRKRGEDALTDVDQLNLFYNEDKYTIEFDGDNITVTDDDNSKNATVPFK